ncbi:MAG: hypothetical protein ACRENV_07340 [Candidatus Dormibacteria bacterium]
MQRIMIQIDEDVLALMDDAAATDGISRAALARQAITSALAERRRLRELQGVVDSYAAAPPEDLSLPGRTLQEAWPEP